MNGLSLPSDAVVAYSRDPGGTITPRHAEGHLVALSDFVAVIETSDGKTVDCWLGGNFNLERVGA